jgi:hypothetical protein
MSVVGKDNTEHLVRVVLVAHEVLADLVLQAFLQHQVSLMVQEVLLVQVFLPEILKFL